MRVLLTGAQGFAGRYVSRELEEHGHTLFKFLHHEPESPDKNIFTGDLKDQATLTKIVHDLKPDACIHLAGIALVPLGWENPHRIFEVNTLGTIHLLEAFRHAHKEARILIITSSEVYGREPRETPLKEDAAMRPSNLYAMSKVAADRSALLYAERYNMPIMTARPQNHIGPGQSSHFVTTSFAKQLLAIANGEGDPVLKVGNLENKRNFLDVRDVARAYRLLIENGTPGEAYNIASHHIVSIKHIVEQLCELTDIDPLIEIDPERYRPTDNPPILDAEKIKDHIKWIPEIPLFDSLKTLVNHLR
ncbi:MAG: NAD-dependent epimerase/dehydratase family protein [Kiritimatiellae bacterium]|nr:NAD-dependent epimerase/dehydratase family protein [Kiritimatiellia bacterium]